MGMFSIAHYSRALLHRRWTWRPGIIDIITSQCSYPGLFGPITHSLQHPHLSFFLFFFLCSQYQKSIVYPCIPNPGSMPACLRALARRESISFLSAFCDAANALTWSSSANLAPLGYSSRSRSTVAHIVTFSPLTVMTPGSLTSCISHRGIEGSEEGVASGLRAAIRS